MSTQKNFRLSERSVLALQEISKKFGWSETKTIEYLLNLYVEGWDEGWEEKARKNQ